MSNLEEMNKFLEIYNLPSMNQEEIENNRPIISNKIETVMKKHPQQTKVQEQTASQVNFTKHLNNR